ncbi:MAG: LysM peptidoglycan-binding domain-containing protein [Chloroflexota bacterium]
MIKKFTQTFFIIFISTACTTAVPASLAPSLTSPTVTPPGDFSATPLPTRPTYNPGELVDYIAQTGDTLPSLAGHFNTSVEDILAENTIIPRDVTTLPPGLPLKIPIYYRSFWGTSFQILPDSQFINGPAAVTFDTQVFIDQHNGWLRDYTEYAAGENRTSDNIIDYVASNFSISPQILLAYIEQQSEGLSNPQLPANINEYPLGYSSQFHPGLYLQLVWAANQLNNGYYGWRSGDLIEFDHQDGTTEHPDPWQNSATVAIQYLYNTLLPTPVYQNMIGPNGIAKTYATLFGDPWEADIPHISGSLIQPDFRFPFEPNKIWALTGGPHTGWGTGAPFAAIDFAPSSTQTGCYFSNEWTTAISDGIVVRSEPGLLILDVDGDGDARTGWAIFYLHIEGRDLASVGTLVKSGDRLGHPSCEGGTSTGTHIHISRKYNGEWMIADSALPFVMEGWVPQAGTEAYRGSLTRFGETIIACECATRETFIQSSISSEEN